MLISGPVDLPPPWGVELVRVSTAVEMHEAVERARRDAHALFMAAAVADWAPRAEARKIKKTAETVTLTLDRGPDILAAVGRDKGKLLLVGFAAETDDVETNARAKLEGKNLDFIVANDVSRPDAGMDSDYNAITLLGRDGSRRDVARARKGEIAEAILDRVFGEGDAA